VNYSPGAGFEPPSSRSPSSWDYKREPRRPATPFSCRPHTIAAIAQEPHGATKTGKLRLGRERRPVQTLIASGDESRAWSSRHGRPLPTREEVAGVLVAAGALALNGRQGLIDAIRRPF
jgi:hypothetical protein